MLGPDGLGWPHSQPYLGSVVGAITYLMLGAPAAVASLHRAAFPGVTSRPSISIAGHPGLIIGMLAYTCIVVRMVVLGGSLVQLLQGEVLSMILFSLDSTLLIEVDIPFHDHPFHNQCSVIQHRRCTDAPTSSP